MIFQVPLKLNVFKYGRINELTNKKEYSMKISNKKSFKKLKVQLKANFKQYRCHVFDSFCLIYIQHSLDETDKIIEKIKLFKPYFIYKYNDDKCDYIKLITDECSICLEELNCDDNILLECNHMFHESCIDKLEFEECNIENEEFYYRYMLGYSKRNAGFDLNYMKCPLCRKESISVLLSASKILKKVSCRDNKIYLNWDADIFQITFKSSNTFYSEYPLWIDCYYIN